MGIEFDPVSSSYYTTAYTGNAAPGQPVETPPSEAQAAPPRPPADSPPPPVDNDGQPVPADAEPVGNYPGGAVFGSVVDEMV